MKDVRHAWIAPALGIGVYEEALNPENLVRFERKTLRNNLQDNLWGMHERTSIMATHGVKRDKRDGSLMFTFLNESRKGDAFYLSEFETQEFLWLHVSDVFLFYYVPDGMLTLAPTSRKDLMLFSDDELHRRINAIKAYEASRKFTKRPGL